MAMKKAPGPGKIAPRKRMAMGEMGEKFGCDSYESVHGGKPITPQGSGALNDSGRAAAPAVKHKGMMKQARPQH